MKLELGILKVWEALAILCQTRDGHPISEARSKSILRGIGMKKSEMDRFYPEEGMEELEALCNDPEKLKKEAKEASEWMISRN